MSKNDFNLSDGDYSSLIEKINKRQLDDIKKEVEKTNIEHAAHSRTESITGSGRVRTEPAPKAQVELGEDALNSMLSGKYRISQKSAENQAYSKTLNSTDANKFEAEKISSLRAQHAQVGQNTAANPEVLPKPQKNRSQLFKEMINCVIASFMLLIFVALGILFADFEGWDGIIFVMIISSTLLVYILKLISKFKEFVRAK